jgi:zinc transport system permease protein
MAYFGDTLSHAALMGVTLGILLGIAPMVGVIATAIAVGLALALLQRQRKVAADTLLGILSHATLALGLILASLLDKVRVDLMGYLFGDILAIGLDDIAWVYGVGAVILAGLALIWRRLIALIVDEDTAVAEGIAAGHVRLAFTVLVALTVGLAMKVVGILLVTALLIIPAATARIVSRSPETMALYAAGVGLVAVTGGIAAALAWDLPAGPSVVVTAAVLFVAALAGGRLFAAAPAR